MKDSDKLAVDQESTEVELSAQDLLDLSPPDAETPASRGATIQQAASSSTEQGGGETDASASGDAARPPRARRLSAAVVLTIGAVAAAAAAVAVIVPMERGPQAIQTAMAPSPSPAIEEPAPPEVVGPPVLFKNPFDDTEVFEFPPGTSPEEARAAVADLLVMRARERQEQLEARARNRN
jgi:hypothetical protein